MFAGKVGSNLKQDYYYDIQNVTAPYIMVEATKTILLSTCMEIGLMKIQLRRNSMKNKVNRLLIGFFLVVFSNTALGDVTTLSIATDTSWKSLDFENEGWTSESYDDSWWTPVEERDYCTIDPGKMIWYSSAVKPNIAYFRNVFELDGTKILNGKLYAAMASGGIKTSSSSESSGRIKPKPLVLAENLPTTRFMRSKRPSTTTVVSCTR